MALACCFGPPQPNRVSRPFPSSSEEDEVAIEELMEDDDDEDE